MKILKIVGIVVAILIVILIALPFIINVNSFRPRIESELTQALGRQVTVGNLSLSLLSGNVGAFLAAFEPMVPAHLLEATERYRDHARPARDHAAEEAG